MAALVSEHLLLLHLALDEPLGLVLRTNDPVRMRQALYAARAASGDPRLTVLQVRMSPVPDGQLVIVRGQSPLGRPVPDVELDAFNQSLMEEL